MLKENDAQVITTIDENGDEIMLRLQEIVSVDGRDYALLSLVAENDDKKTDDENTELVLMKMNQTEDECTFEVIEDDEEFNAVAQAIGDDEEE